MSTADRFDRYLETLLDDLAGEGAPAYLDSVLAMATAGPQRRRAILERALGRDPLAPRPSGLRPALVALVLVVALALVGVGILVIGIPGPQPTTPPSEVPTSALTAPPSPTSPVTQTPEPSPTVAAFDPCPGYADAADARVVTKAGDIAWQATIGVLPEGTTPRNGKIAAYADELASGRPAVVLVDPATGDACRLLDLEAEDEVFTFGWSSHGDALAISTATRVLVWSSAGIAQVYASDGGPGDIEFDWSPTGDVLAVNRYGFDRPILVFADGSRHRVPIDQTNYLGWSPDGSLLAILGVLPSDKTAGEGVVLMARAGEQISAVRKGVGALGWLDSNTLIGAESGSGAGFRAYDVPSGSWRNWAASWVSEDLGVMKGIGFAPGMTAVALFANHERGGGPLPMDLVVIDLPSGENHVVGPQLYPPNNAGGEGAWAPDGTRLAVSVDGFVASGLAQPGLWLFDRSGGAPTLLSGLNLRVAPGAWQPAP